MPLHRLEYTKLSPRQMKATVVAFTWLAGVFIGSALGVVLGLLAGNWWVMICCAVAVAAFLSGGWYVSVMYLEESNDDNEERKD